MPTGFGDELPLRARDLSAHGMSRANLELCCQCVLLVLQLVLGRFRFAASQGAGGRGTARQESGGRSTARQQASATQTRCQGLGLGCHASSGQVRGRGVRRRLPGDAPEAQLTVYAWCAALESFSAGAAALAVEALDCGLLVLGGSREQSRFAVVIAANDGCLVGALPLPEYGAEKPRQEIALLRSQSGQTPRPGTLADRDLPGRGCLQFAAPLSDRHSHSSAAGAVGDLEVRSRQTLNSQSGRVVPSLVENLQPGLARPSGVGATTRAGREEKEDQLLGVRLEVGEEGKEAMLLLEALGLKKVRDASRRVDGRGSSGGAFGLFDEGHGDDSGGRSGQRSSDSLMKIRRSTTKNPAGWNSHLASTTGEQLFAGITNKPWSFYDYVLQRTKFTHAEVGFERFAHTFANLHAIRRRGSDSYEELGAAIRQGFKALEQGHRGRSDSALAWLWTEIPERNPPRRSARGLAHPSKHSAGAAYIREMQTLQSHHEEALDDDLNQGHHEKGKKGRQRKDDYGHKGEYKNLGKDKNGGGKKSKKGGGGGRGCDGPPAQ
jgi:hypothetical protein